MFNAITLALVAFCNMITTFCHAGEKVAKTADELAGWSNESAAAFHDEAKHNREVSIEENAFKRDQRRKELAAAKAAAAAAGNKPAAAPKAAATTAP